MPRDHVFSTPSSHSFNNGRGRGHDDPRLKVIFRGSNRDDVIEANDGNNLIFGRNGDDVIVSGAGVDLIDGGRGTDTSVYAGGVADYDITTPGRHWWQPTVVSGANGTDLLTRVEALYFEGDGYTLWLDGTNNAVLAGDDAAATGEDTALTLDTADLLANDREFDGDTMTVTGVSATSAAGVAVTLSGGTITYDTAGFDSLGAGETVTDTFSYTVDDGKGGTDTATVTITITGTNDAPEVAAGSVTVDENTTAVAAGVIATDAEGDPVSFALSGADAALFTIDATTGTIAFKDAPDFETPRDDDGDNAYELTVEASDGTDTGSTDITVTVADVTETSPTEARINELHYDNTGADTGEFIEVRLPAGADASGIRLALYNGNGGATYGNILPVTDGTQSSDGTWDYYVISLPSNGLQNGSPDGLALFDDLGVIEFLSYEGTLTATGGPAAGLTSDDIGVSEPGSTPVGFSLQRNDDGTWSAPAAHTAGAANDGGGGGGGTPTLYLISEVQGEGFTSPYEGQQGVQVEAVVTYVTEDGFYLTEETGDWRNYGTASQGIYVFAGGGQAVAVGDLVSVTGTVTEFFGLTELTDVTDLTVLDTNQFVPIVNVSIGPNTINDWETLEGMYVSVTSATADPLTITANFNLDRFGEISISAGSPVQPTQLYDAGSPEALAAIAENANNTLLLNDGLPGSNPDEFIYIPNTGPGDNGNGILDAGDNIATSTTPRLGTVIDAPVEGVLTYGFGNYQVIVDGVLSLDESSNPRPAAPADTGGSLQIASINMLNYFTSFSGGTGPNGASVRGADTAEEFARQTEGLTAEILGIGADVAALQELENNGFSGTSAIVTLTGELDAASGGGTDYRAVNPYDYITDPWGGAGYIGTDAITTGIIYDANEVTLVYAEVLEYDEASNAVTNTVASDLGGYIGFTWDSFDRNRPSVAATFADNDTGEQFTVVSSHFKSKGDSDLQDIADAAEAWLANNPADADYQAVSDTLQQLYADPNFDQGDGQGFWNAVRTDAAIELADWIGTEYNGTGTDTVIFLGDMNSYIEEDPVQYLDDEAGLTDLISTLIGAEQAYSYVFDGQTGNLDQALVDDAMLPFVTGATEWHVNADEPDLFNYDTSFNDPAFDAPGPFAASDHDPIIVGLEFALA